MPEELQIHVQSIYLWTRICCDASVIMTLTENRQHTCIQVQLLTSWMAQGAVDPPLAGVAPPQRNPARGQEHDTPL